MTAPKPGHLALSAALLTLAALPAAAKTYQVSDCSYFDTKRNIAITDKVCSMDTGEKDGNYETTLHLSGGINVTVEYVKSDMNFHIWKINGEPGFGHEFDREDPAGATLDLNQIIEWHEPD